MKTFAIIGACGFVARRHIKAIHDIGGEIIHACDVSDIAGHLDQHFINCSFTRSNDEFFHRVRQDKIDYVVVCTPNYMHYPHSMRAIESGAEVICEKPAAITLEQLQKLVKYGEKFNVIHQLRLMPMVEELEVPAHSEIQLTYVTPRGNWYDKSWKSNPSQAGSLLMNIGIHFVDLLLLKYGACKEYSIDLSSKDTIEGTMQLDRAHVNFHLSIAGNRQPTKVMTVNGYAHDLSRGFGELHTKCYQQILRGKGFHAKDAYPAVSLILEMQNKKALV